MRREGERGLTDIQTFPLGALVVPATGEGARGKKGEESVSGKKAAARERGERKRERRLTSQLEPPIRKRLHILPPHVYGVADTHIRLTFLVGPDTRIRLLSDETSERNVTGESELTH